MLTQQMVEEIAVIVQMFLIDLGGAIMNPFIQW